MQISVVIPIYNTVAHIIEHLPDLFGKMKDNYESFEFIFIIDNVEDIANLSELSQTTEKSTEVQVYYLNKNYGQHFATLCGYYLAKGEYIVCIDEDMSIYLDKLIITQQYIGVDVFYFIYSKRKIYKSKSRSYLGRFYRFIIAQIFGLRIHSTFRVIKRELRDKLLEKKYLFYSLDFMIRSIAKSMDYEVFETKSNELIIHSSYNYKRLIKISFTLLYDHFSLIFHSLIAILTTILVYLVIAKSFVFFLFPFITIVLQALYILKRNKQATTNNKIKVALKLNT